MPSTHKFSLLMRPCWCVTFSAATPCLWTPLPQILQAKKVVVRGGCSCRARSSRTRKKAHATPFIRLKKRRGYNIVRMVGASVRNNTANRCHHWMHRLECAHLVPLSVWHLRKTSHPNALQPKYLAGGIAFVDGWCGSVVGVGACIVWKGTIFFADLICWRTSLGANDSNTSSARQTPILITLRQWIWPIASVEVSRSITPFPARFGRTPSCLED